jgi:RNA-binding protein 26
MGQNPGLAMPQQPPAAYMGQQPGAFAGMQGMPSDPMSALLAMQAMGFPMAFPGMPGMQPMPTPSRRGRFGTAKEKRRGRCRNYDKKGFCERGSTCPYEHVNAPPGSEGKLTLLKCAGEPQSRIGW